jgi:hypothetical protein
MDKGFGSGASRSGADRAYAVLVPVGSAAAGSLLTAALNGPLPQWALISVAAVAVVFGLFVGYSACRVIANRLRPVLRRRRASARNQADVSAIASGLLDLTSAGHVNSVASVFNRMHTVGFVDAEATNAFHSQVRLVSNWSLWLAQQLSAKALSPLAAFQALCYPLVAYTEICNNVLRLVEARTGSVTDVTGAAVLKRDWHVIATNANDLVQQYRQVAQRINAQLGTTEGRTYFEIVAQWP